MNINKIKENLKTIWELIKKYKWGLIIIVALILMVYRTVEDNKTFTGQKPSSNTGIITKQKGTLRFVGAVPENGVRNTMNSHETVELKFGSPINAATLYIEIEPKIAFRTFSPKKTPTSLYILPTAEGWESKTEYTITVSKLHSLDAKLELKSTIIYKYQNILSEELDTTKVY